MVKKRRFFFSERAKIFCARLFPLRFSAKKEAENPFGFPAFQSLYEKRLYEAVPFITSENSTGGPATTEGEPPVGGK